jgi:hypothetical protein
MPTGPPHPCFPKTILHFWLLSESEINSIAQYYSQTEPDEYTLTYPHPMLWDHQAFSQMSTTERICAKRRELALFIGLRANMGAEHKKALSWLEKHQNTWAI